MKKLILIIVLLCGCQKEEILTITETSQNYNIAITYPNTKIKQLNNEIIEYITTTEQYFKTNYNEFNIIKNELNIDCEYLINKDITKVLLITNINNNPIEIKTLIYEKNIKINAIDQEISLKEPQTIKISEMINNITNPTANSDSSKLIALTFDDGPSNYTIEIINLLNKYDAKATFFILGNKALYYQETIKTMLITGHEIANHSYSHKWLTRLNQDQLIEEITKTQDIILQLTGYEMQYLRPTYGSINQNIRNTIELDIIMWTLDSNDWKTKDKNQIESTILNNVKENDIILLHDIHNQTYEAMKTLIPKLIEQGYQLVTVSQLLEKKSDK